MGKILKNRKVLLIIGGIIIIALIIVLCVCLSSNKVVCTQKANINGVVNTNTVMIKYKDDSIKKVETTYKYVAKKKNNDVLKQIKTSLANLQDLYKSVKGVEFKEAKETDKTYELTQIVDFDAIADKDLEKVSIDRKYKKAIANYEAADYKCK